MGKRGCAVSVLVTKLSIPCPCTSATRTATVLPSPLTPPASHLSRPYCPYKPPTAPTACSAWQACCYAAENKAVMSNSGGGCANRRVVHDAPKGSSSSHVAPEGRMLHVLCENVPNRTDPKSGPQTDPHPSKGSHCCPVSLLAAWRGNRLPPASHLGIAQQIPA